MLASRLATPRTRTAFWHLPPSLRLLAHQQASRSFSASASRSEAAPITLERLVTGVPLYFMDGIHALGLPWWAVIPTTALVFRGILMHYASEVPSRHRQQIRQNLIPLTQSFKRIQDSIEAQNKGLDEKEPNVLSKWVRNIWRDLRTQHTVGNWYGAGLTPMPSLRNFFTLIAVSEAIRMKSGASSGILSTVLAIPNWFVAKAQGHDHIQYQAEAIAERIQRVREERSRLAEAPQPEASDSESLSEFMLNADALPNSHGVNTASPWFDPSMQTEGFAWISDLTVADPTYLLPTLYFLTVTGTSLAKLSLVRGVPTCRQLASFLLSADGLKIILAGGFTMILSEWSAAIVLYLTSSSLVNKLQKRWMDITMPLGPAITRCVRHTRVRARKEWSARQ